MKHKCRKCGKFFYTRNLRCKCCSHECYRKLRQVAHQCHVCGKPFFTDKGSINRAKDKLSCSRSCVYEYGRLNSIGLSSKQSYSNRIKPLGSEITIRSGAGIVHLYVKVRERSGGRNGRNPYRRKAVVTLEKVLGRKLIVGEGRQIKFIDGDRLNCKLENLVLLSARLMRVCSVCGEGEVMRFDEGSRLPFCSTCYRKRFTSSKVRHHIIKLRPLWSQGRKLDVTQVSLLRRLAITENWAATLSLHNKPRYGPKLSSLTLWDIFTYKGVTGNYRYFAEKYGVDTSCFRARLLNSWPIRKAIETPVRHTLNLLTVARWFGVTPGHIQRIQRQESWKGVRPMAKSQVWKALLKQHDVLKKQAGVTLYDRVTILAKVYEDPHYLAEMSKGKRSPIEQLDSRVSDTCANFTELLQMLKMFPRKTQWASGNLSSMRLKMLELLREQQNGNRAPVKKRKKVDQRKSATIAEVRELDQEKERLKRELKSANRIIKSLEEQLEAARETIGTLNESISLFRIDKKDRQTVKA